MERLTQTSDRGGVAFTFDLDITCEPSEAKKILRLAEKLKQYEDLGTVEELQQAKEKMKPKKVITWADGTEHCPNCDYDNSCIGYDVCIDCGQKLDWSE